MNRKLQNLSNRVKELHFSLRWLLGVSLIIGGLLWFLPILGLWMIPLGLLVLAPDFKWARRGYLAVMVWLRRFRDHRKQRRNAIKAARNSHEN